MATSEEILREVIGKALLLRIGKRAIAIINVRTSKGKFLPGSSPGAEKYSTKPFAMPIGAVSKKSVMFKMLKGKYDDDTQLFQSAKSKKLWVAIKKGYKWYREQSGRGSSIVDLVWSRKLRRSLTVLKTDIKTGLIEIGHSDKRSDQIAQYHNELGAGKSKKIRKYLGLTEDELEGLSKLI